MWWTLRHCELEMFPRFYRSAPLPTSGIQSSCFRWTTAVDFFFLFGFNLTIRFNRYSVQFFFSNPSRSTNDEVAALLLTYHSGKNYGTEQLWGRSMTTHIHQKIRTGTWPASPQLFDKCSFTVISVLCGKHIDIWCLLSNWCPSECRTH